MKYFNVVIERDSEGYYIASVPELLRAVILRQNHWIH